MTASTAIQPGETALLSVSDLHVSFAGRDAATHAVRGLSYTLSPSETLGIVGESGSGKTQSAMALMGLLPDSASTSGQAFFDGTDLLQLSPKELNRIRGRRISMVFQDPMTALNPHLTVFEQMSLVLKTHMNLRGKAAELRCIEMLDAVRIPEAKQSLHRYPHELSGGMRQRVMIASALLCEPELLIADEPTTALDVTVQAQILNLLTELQQEFATAVLLITHDMGVVAGHCDRVLVMQQGECVERNAADELFASPSHPYTRALLKAVPRLNDVSTDLNVPEASAELDVADLSVDFSVPGDVLLGGSKTLHALRNIGFSVAPGETLGVVGESGCGKSTMARAVLRLVEPVSGDVVLAGSNLLELNASQLHAKRKDIQIIFQDPLASLNPRMTVGDILTEPLDTYQPELSKVEMRERAATLLEKVGLEEEHINRYPHEFSGGQCQRIGIARALMFEPKLIVCDEPVSALDVSVQARIVELLIGLQKELGLSLVFIAHDLAVVRQVSHRVMVMYLGRAVEIADRDAIYENPQHPYTQALIDAVPIPDPAIEKAREQRLLQGDLPSPLEPPPGCAFSSRCPKAQGICREAMPDLEQVGASLVACHFPGK